MIYEQGLIIFDLRRNTKRQTKRPYWNHKYI